VNELDFTNHFKEPMQNKKPRMTEKQIRIMAAAIEIFAQKGYAATTTSEIAKKAGVGEGTIFHHYKTKKDLLLAIPDYLGKSIYSRGLMEDLVAIFENPHDRFEDFVKAIIYNRRDFVLKNIALIKVLFQEVPYYPELRDKIAGTVLIPTMGKLIEAVDFYKKEGQIMDIPSPSIVKLLLTTILGYFYTLYIAALEWNEEPQTDLDHLVLYLTNGLRGQNNAAGPGHKEVNI
jgi:AcrR family transcriptional regulator